MLRMLTVLMALAAAIPAQAQDWPTRPMTMIVPFAAGGAVDVLARALGARTAEILGQQIMIENVGRRRRHDRRQPRRQGRARRLQLRARQRRHACAEPDALQDAGLRRAEGLRAGGLVSERRCCWWRSSDLPANNLQEFIAYAKANDGQAAIRLGGRGLRGASRLRAVQRRGRHQGDAHSLSGRRAGDAGPGRRPHRLHLQHHHQRVAQRQKQPDQGRWPILRPSARRSFPNCGPRRSRAWTTSTPPPGTWCCCPRERPRRSCRSSMPRSARRWTRPTTKERLLNIGLDIPPPEKRSPEYATKFVESEIRKYEGPIKAAGIVIE